MASGDGNEDFYLVYLINKYLPYVRTAGTDYLKEAWGISQEIDERQLPYSSIAADIRECVHSGKLQEAFNLVDAYLDYIEKGHQEGLAGLWKSQKINDSDKELRAAYIDGKVDELSPMRDLAKLREYLGKSLRHERYIELESEFSDLLYILPDVKTRLDKTHRLLEQNRGAEAYISLVMLSRSIKKMIEDSSATSNVRLLQFYTELDSLKFIVLKKELEDLNKGYKRPTYKRRAAIGLLSAAAFDLSNNLGFLSKRAEDFATMLRYTENLTTSQIRHIMHILLDEYDEFIKYYKLNFRPIVNQVLQYSKERQEMFLNGLIRRDLYGLGAITETAKDLLFSLDPESKNSRAGLGRYRKISPPIKFPLLSELAQESANRPMYRLMYGNKAIGCVDMIRKGVSVPDGFVIQHNYPKENMKDSDYNFMLSTLDALARLQHSVYHETGHSAVFGDKERPLVVSVRPTSAVNMPGIMPTVVNVGLTDEIVENMVKLADDPWYIYDSYRRFIKSYAIGVLGMDESQFIYVIDRIKKKEGVRLKTQLNPMAMKQCVDTYKSIIARAGYAQEMNEALSNPHKALFNIIEAVKQAWDSPDVARYCDDNNISRDNSAAILLQYMVFGNKREISNTESKKPSFVGVARSKAASGQVITGEYKISSQGDDIMSSFVTSDSIMNIDTLKSSYPDIYNQLEHIADIMSLHNRAPQVFEFTVDQGRLYILQAVTPSYHDVPDYKIDTLEMPIGKGIGIGGEPLTGIVAFAGSDMKQIREKADALGVDNIIIILDAALPSHTNLIMEADAVIAHRGTAVSHLAVTCNEHNKSGVFGISDMQVTPREAKIGGNPVREGSILTIDPNVEGGLIYEGRQGIFKNHNSHSKTHQAADISGYSRNLLNLIESAA